MLRACRACLDLYLVSWCKSIGAKTEDLTKLLSTSPSVPETVSEPVDDDQGLQKKTPKRKLVSIAASKDSSIKSLRYPISDK